MLFIDAASNLCVAATAEYGGRAGIRIYASEVIRCQWKAAVLVINGFGVVQEEGAFGLIELVALRHQR